MIFKLETGASKLGFKAKQGFLGVATSVIPAQTEKEALLIFKIELESHGLRPVGLLKVDRIKT